MAGLNILNLDVGQVFFSLYGLLANSLELIDEFHLGHVNAVFFEEAGVVAIGPELPQKHGAFGTIGVKLNRKEDTPKTSASTFLFYFFS
jgi:hypothetical protein